MAEVYLTAAELKGNRDLPGCCLVCGRRKTTREQVQFAANAGTSWTPLTGSQTTMRYLTVSLPLCSEHKDYFNRWGWLLLKLILGVFGLFFVLIIVSVIAGIALGGNAGYVILPVWLLAFVALVGFGAFAFLGTRGGVHTRGIDRGGIRLVNVSQQFADTLEELREEAGPEGEDEEEFEAFSEGGPVRPRRRSSRDDEEDDRPRSRRRDRDEEY